MHSTHKTKYAQLQFSQIPRHDQRKIHCHRLRTKSAPQTGYPPDPPKCSPTRRRARNPAAKRTRACRIIFATPAKQLRGTLAGKHILVKTLSRIQSAASARRQCTFTRRAAFGLAKPLTYARTPSMLKTRPRLLPAALPARGKTARPNFSASPRAAARAIEPGIGRARSGVMHGLVPRSRGFRFFRVPVRSKADRRLKLLAQRPRAHG